MHSIMAILDSSPSSSRVLFGIWQSGLPLKFSFFMWRLLGNKLPVREVLFKFQVCGPSNCYCCSSPEIESLHHLFITSEIFNLIYKHFEGPLGIFRPNTIVRQKLVNWQLRQLLQSNPRLKWLFRVAPFVIF